MPAILKVGYTHYLVKSEAKAIAALTALSEAVEVREDYKAKVGQYFYPEEHSARRDQVTLTIIRPEKLRREKLPDPEDEPRDVKLLDFNGKVHCL